MAELRNFVVAAFTIFLGLRVLVTLTQAECNLCGISNVACVSETQYQTCTGGVPQGTVLSCPSGKLCTTAEALFCQPNATTTVITCQQCNICDVTQVFACISRTEYALCLGTGQPSSVTGSCGASLVCNVNSPGICITETTTTLASCPAATNTVPPTSDPVTYCRSVQKVGRHPVGNNLNTTCRQYILCFVNGGIWSGNTYTCPGSTYFNATSGLCTKGAERRCTTTTIF